jgi:hypothetical protein
MSLRRGLALVLLLAALFLLFNKAAYKGWFNDDDLDNLAWRSFETLPALLGGLANPLQLEFNDRPAGHLYYWTLWRTAGLVFPPFLAVLHLLHLLNCLLLYRLIRRLGAEALHAAAGTLFFAVHMACFDAFWKPMFVYDVLCGTFVLLALLAYLHPHRASIAIALAAFWLALKSKELAAALPLAIAAYEWFCGGRRWKRVAPFLAIGAWFVVQGLLRSGGPDTDYTLRFNPDALATTLRFYSSQLLLVPFAGTLIIPAFLLTKDPRARFALVSIPLLLGPLWFLPGRLFAVYLYVPLIAAAIAFAFLAAHARPAWLAVFFAAWLPWNYLQMREGRRAALTVSPENRSYSEQVQRTLAQSAMKLQAAVLDGRPTYMGPWGPTGLLRLLTRHATLPVVPFSDPSAAELLRRPDTLVVGWNRRDRLVTSSMSHAELSPDLTMARTANVWQLERGWLEHEGAYRWTLPTALATLARPASATRLVLELNVGPAQFQTQRRIVAEALVDGQSLGVREYAQEGWHAREWPLSPSTRSEANVELRFSPPFSPGGEALGAAVSALALR